jgi:hypothetical protein
MGKDGQGNITSCTPQIGTEKNYSRFLPVIITYYYDPDFPQTLTSSRKDQECGADEPACPGEPSKRLPDPGKWLKSPPAIREIPRIPAEKAPKQTQGLVLKFS